MTAEDGSKSKSVETENKDWKLEEIARALDTSFRQQEDKIGRGVVYKFGEQGREKFLAVYPDQSTIRVVKGKKDFILSGMNPPLVSDNKVVFDGKDSEDNVRLKISKRGDIVYRVSKIEHAKALNKELQEEIQLVGRIAEDPIYISTRNGGLFGRFPLITAVDESSDTELKTVCIFDRYAYILRPVLKRGQFVEISGFIEQREVIKNGEKRHYSDIHAREIKVAFVHPGRKE